MNTELFSAPWRNAYKQISTTQSFRIADYLDAPWIAAVVNAANSGAGGAGWTNEANLFEGDRTHIDEILEMLAAPGTGFLLFLEEGKIAGCVYLKTMDNAGYMGLLAVWPERQARGIGTHLIEEAERLVRDEWGCGAMLISVIVSHRPELTAYYQRRGYQRTGRAKAFERKQAKQGRMAAGLRLEWMEKNLRPA